MKYTAIDLETVFDLRRRGVTAREIAKRSGIPFGTVREWLYRRIPNLDSAGERCATCEARAHRFDALPPDYVYLLGLYLGDGSIATHPRGVYKLRLSLDAAYPGIIKEAALAMRQVMPTSRVGSRLSPSSYVEVYSYSKGWPCLFPQHGPGKKHLRPLLLTDWQDQLVSKRPELLLRGLIHSDGCRFMNLGRGWQYARYGFSNLSSDIREIFTYACDLLQLHWTAAGNRTIYVSRKADVARMDTFIGPKA